MARYLVTGVAGFIGSWIAQRLVSQGHQVRGLDNMSSGTVGNLSAIGSDLDFRRVASDSMGGFGQLHPHRSGRAQCAARQDDAVGDFAAECDPFREHGR